MKFTSLLCRAVRVVRSGVSSGLTLKFGIFDFDFTVTLAHVQVKIPKISVTRIWIFQEFSKCISKMSTRLFKFVQQKCPDAAVPHFSEF